MILLNDGLNDAMNDPITSCYEHARNDPIKWDMNDAMKHPITLCYEIYILLMFFNIS